MGPLEFQEPTSSEYTLRVTALFRQEIRKEANCKRKMKKTSLLNENTC